MKKRNKTYAACASLLLSFLFAGNAIGSDKPGNEFSVWGQGGLSGLKYNLSRGDSNLQFGGGGGIGYTTYFSPHWGFNFGLELMSYRSKATLDNFSDNYYVDDPVEQQYLLQNEYTNYEETQNALYLNIPLMFQYQGNGVHKFYGAIGGKIGFPLSGKYKSDADNLETTGYFDYENGTYRNIVSHNFTSNQLSHKDDLNLKATFMLSAEAGIKWRLSNSVNLYTGIFADYGLTNVLEDDATHRLTEYGGDGSITTANMEHHSILASKYSNTTTNGNEETFTDKAHLLSVGLKVKLGFNLKGKHDSDNDGVADDKDLCADTPSAVRVDKNGCPVDSDGDGVPDYLDQCPKTHAGVKVNKNGCPDEDGDGVADRDDQCPNTPVGAKVDERGCPISMDADGDGVEDEYDQCPNTLQGVPVDKNGCPVDSDGDGVPDYLDQCPKTAGKAENRGCPTLKAADAKVLKQAIYGVWFDVDKSSIKPGSYGILNQVAKIMRDNPKYMLDIDGHTDASGGYDHNQVLSENRAQSVVSYLIDKGVNPARLRAMGHGQTMPVATNSTIEGKAQNRRVEFTVRFE